MNTATRRLTATALAALAFPLVLAFSATSAQAQVANANACKGNVFIDSVYQTGLGGNDYEYHIQIRNQTSTPRKWTLTFAHLPKGVTAFSPQLTGGTLGANASETIKFGKGTNGNINSNTIKPAYDQVPGYSSATLTKCTKV